ncbi:purine and uridine phosphorylase [Xylariaceae sp. FL1272]|nr:purine and uridine phosphorylase [Xylariaceae sp. FL1272]
MRRSFWNIRFCLLVGIGGGVPSKEHDIRLGDVVVSIPTGEYPGVIQYDRGKENENSLFEPSGSLPPPPWFLRTAISRLESNPNRPSSPLQHYLVQIQQRITSSEGLKYRHPGQEYDTSSPNECSRGHRSTEDPQVFYGLIASGNRVIKDAHFRNELAQKCGVLCFEMEAAGIMNTFPCLVIRGICDYADSSKNKIWQEYAAATAAAYAKLLLDEVSQSEGQHGGLPVKRANTLAFSTDGEMKWKRRRM